MNDPVNKPAHYTSYKGIEVIQLTEQLNFSRGNVVKYVARAGLKGDSIYSEIQDLEKAKWYLDREVERVRAIRDNCLVCTTHGHTESPPIHDERALEIRQSLGIESSTPSNPEDAEDG
jgi:hypothetical protein